MQFVVVGPGSVRLVISYWVILYITLFLWHFLVLGRYVSVAPKAEIWTIKPCWLIIQHLQFSVVAEMSTYPSDCGTSCLIDQQIKSKTCGFWSKDKRQYRWNWTRISYLWYDELRERERQRDRQTFHSVLNYIITHHYKTIYKLIVLPFHMQGS